MKTLLTFCIICTFHAFSQSGGIQVCLSGADDHCYWSDQKVYCFRVTATQSEENYVLVDSAVTDHFGWVTFNRLQSGNYQLTITEGNKDWIASNIQVQDKQLFVSQAYVTESYTRSIAQAAQLKYIEGNPANDPSVKTTLMRQDVQRIPSNSRLYTLDAEVENSIEEITILAYRVPLISSNVTSGYTISREAVNTGMMNTQASPISMTQTLLSTPGINNVSIRGSRMDASSYYVDGVRVRGIDVPNSMIGTVQVITGGIPANYGDVTGGVILVTTDVGRKNFGYSNPSYSGTYRSIKTEIEEPRIRFDRFAPIYENQFLATRQHAHSTFGLDVDRASWSYCKRILDEGGSLSRDAVKVEEFINSFKHKEMNVSDEALLDVQLERMACPWNEQHQLVAVHLKAADLKQELDLVHHQYTFLIDVSGSMSGADRLGLIKEGMKNLVDHLDERDRVSIVTYAGYETVALYPTNGDQKATIKAAIDQLGAGGSTNGSGGLKMAYDLATEMYDPQANNRVILATDGDFNVGISNPQELEQYISTQRGKGIYLTALGVGMGNYRNDILETLSDKGDGNHFYIKDLHDADEVLVKNIGNLLTVARDVKLDVQFNPELVKEYRLLGYENRLMPSQDFKDDTKDGGEVGVGHQVVALYEIEPGTDLTTESKSDTVVYQADDIAAVLLRYKPRDAQTSIEKSFHVNQQTPLTENPSLVLSAALALELRNSPFKGTCSPMLIGELAQKVNGTEYEELLEVCKKLVQL